MREIESRLQARTAEKQHAAATPAEFVGLAEQLDLVGNDPCSDAGLKKRIVRTLIQEVVADVESCAGEIILVIHLDVDCR